MLNLFLITLITVLIIDISGFINSIKFLISKILKIKDYRNIRLKPIDCSFCMNFWLGIIYLFITSNITLLNLSIVLLLSFSTETLKDVLTMIKDILTKIINEIYTLLNL